MKTITLNGADYQTSAQNLSQLLDTLALNVERLAVEVNQEIVPRSTFATTPVQSGDQIEIIHAIGGG